jgi:putative phage-type endonuclease
MTAMQAVPDLQDLPELDRHDAYVRFLIEDTDYENQSDDIQWHIRRRFGIGGSDVGAILGVNPYKTPYDVWLEKTGREMPVDLSDNDAVMAGNLFEDAVAKFYEIREGKKVRRWNDTRFHDDMPWLAGNVDRIVQGERRILECKTAGMFAKGWGEPGTDEVPESYLLQVMHYMSVWGYDVADLAVVIGGQQYRKYTFKFDQELFDVVAEHLRSFWFNNVIADVPPEPSSLLEIEQFYKKDNGDAVTATAEVAEATERREALKTAKKETEAAIDEQEAIIKGHMGEHAILVDQFGTKLATWKNQTANRFDSTAFKKAHPELHAAFTKQSESRVFRA